MTSESGDDELVIDDHAVAEFWGHCVASGIAEGDESAPAEAGWFGDSAAMADELAELLATSCDEGGFAVELDTAEDVEVVVSEGADQVARRGVERT